MIPDLCFPNSAHLNSSQLSSTLLDLPVQQILAFTILHLHPLVNMKASKQDSI